MQDLRCAHGVTTRVVSMCARHQHVVRAGTQTKTHALSPINLSQASSAIANAFAAGAPDRDRMIEFAARQVDAEPSLLSRLAIDTLAVLGTRAIVASQRDIARLLAAHPLLTAAFAPDSYYSDDEDAPPTAATHRPQRNSFIAAPALTKPPYWPVPATNLPAVDSTMELCDLLEIHPQRLEAWSKRWRQRSALPEDVQQRHSAYFSYWQPKPRGGARLIEIPKPDLKQAQRRLLKRIIERVEPHEAATGFRRGYSIVHHASLHSGQERVLKCDLQDFFVSIRASRVHAIFRHLGYNETVSRALTAIVTSRASSRKTAEGRQFGVDLPATRRYQSDHLPQGAPTSPALANLAAFRLDLRLATLADDAGLRYSRYADDLAFSGAADSGISTQRFYLRLCAIALEEGFNINTRKTRLMTQSQRQYVTGLVVNEQANVVREEFDKLKAILTNAIRHGLDSQNREGLDNFRFHLLGKIAFIAQVNPSRGVKLQRLWAQVRQ